MMLEEMTWNYSEEEKCITVIRYTKVWNYEKLEGFEELKLFLLWLCEGEDVGGV